MSAIHDNKLVSFSVLCEEECIVPHPRAGWKPHRRGFLRSVRVCFRKRSDKIGNILFDIEPVPVDDFIKKYHDSLARGKSYRWPGNISYETTGELAERLAARKLSPFEIDSSLGLTGFVLALSMDLVAVQANAIL